MERCKTHRFTTYWTHRSDLSGLARTVAESRRAVLVHISSADSLFEELAEKIKSLEEFERPHPLSIQTTVTTLKRYLPTSTDKIRLHDLVLEAREHVHQRLAMEQFDYTSPVNADGVQRRLKFYDGSLEVLLALQVTGCYWGDTHHQYLWVETIERLANYSREGGGYTLWIELQRYPAMILLYAGGIAAIANTRYDTLAALLTKPAIAGANRWFAAVCRLYGLGVLDDRAAKMVPGFEKRRTAVSDYLYDRLRGPLH